MTFRILPFWLKSGTSLVVVLFLIKSLEGVRTCQSNPNRRLKILDKAWDRFLIYDWMKIIFFATQVVWENVPVTKMYLRHLYILFSIIASHASFFKNPIIYIYYFQSLLLMLRSLKTPSSIYIIFNHCFSCFVL